jgi:hypothetical protein
VNRVITRLEMILFAYSVALGILAVTVNIFFPELLLRVFIPLLAIFLTHRAIFWITNP